MEIDYRQRLDEALELIESQKLECARLTNEVSDLGRRCRETEASLLHTQGLLANALSELKEQDVRDRELAEIEQTLSKFEDMKRKYEKRIRNLEARLRDAKLKSGRDDDNDELLIDMSPSDSSYGGLFASVIPPERKKPSGLSLARKEPKVKPAAESHSPDKSSPRSEDTDDWLLSLPDAL